VVALELRFEDGVTKDTFKAAEAGDAAPRCGIFAAARATRGGEMFGLTRPEGNAAAMAVIGGSIGDPARFGDSFGERWAEEAEPGAFDRLPP